MEARTTTKQRDGENDESNDYMDSGDFMVSQVSESGFSHSFRGKDMSVAAKQQKAKPQVNHFYQFDESKFSSY